MDKGGYRKLIMEMAEKTDDLKALEAAYTYMKVLTEEGGSRTTGGREAGNGPV